MTTTTGSPTNDTAARAVQVHRVYITAPAQRVWDALLSPECSDRYGYGGFVQSDLQAGSSFVTTAGTGMQEFGVSGPIIDGEVVESDPPRRFVQTWRMLMDDALRTEGFSRLTYDLVETDGVTRLTLTHDVTDAPKTAWLVSGESDAQPNAGGGGWPWVLSDLKSLLETGTAFSRAG